MPSGGASTPSTEPPERHSEAAASDLGENDDPEGPRYLALDYAANRELLLTNAQNKSKMSCYAGAIHTGRSLHARPLAA